MPPAVPVAALMTSTSMSPLVVIRGPPVLRTTVTSMLVPDSEMLLEAESNETVNGAARAAGGATTNSEQTSASTTMMRPSLPVRIELMLAPRCTKAICRPFLMGSYRSSHRELEIPTTQCQSAPLGTQQCRGRKTGLAHFPSTGAATQGRKSVRPHSLVTAAAPGAVRDLLQNRPMDEIPLGIEQGNVARSL